MLALSWGVYLTALDDNCRRLHLRVRCRPGRAWRFPAVTAALFGFVDWMTVAPLIPGLRQRLAATGHPSRVIC